LRDSGPAVFLEDNSVVMKFVVDDDDDDDDDNDDDKNIPFLYFLGEKEKKGILSLPSFHLVSLFYLFGR